MRAQAHTLEGVAAALVVLMAVFFAVQITAVTPLTASTSNQHIENQEQAMVHGVLATAAANGSLRRAVLRWNTSRNRLPNSGREGYYNTGDAPGQFGRALEHSFDGNGLAYNVNFRYLTRDNQREVQRYYYTGSPTSNAVTATWTVTLYDDDHTYDGNGKRTADTIGSSPYFAPDVEPSGNVYNVIQVEVVIWRM